MIDKRRFCTLQVPGDEAHLLSRSSDWLEEEARLEVKREKMRLWVNANYSLFDDEL